MSTLYSYSNYSSYPASVEASGRIGKKIRKGLRKAAKKAFDPREHVKMARKLVSGEDVAPGETYHDVHVGIRNGHAIAVHPMTGTVDSVSLRACGEWLEAAGVIVGSDELYEALEGLDERPQVGGKVGKKIKEGLKKGVKAVATAAKKVAKSKVVQALAKTVKAVVPQPFKAGITAIEKGAQFAKKLVKAKKGSKEAKAKAVVQQLAKGSITPAAATAKAKQLGVKPKDVKNTAAALKLKAAAAAGNPQAQGVVAAAETINRARDGTPADARAAVQLAAEAKLRQTLPGSRVVQVQVPGGGIFLTAVTPVTTQPS